MKRTGAGVIVAAVAIGVMLGFAIDQVLTATGRPTFTPSFLLPILLVLLGAALVAFALPIRRAIAGPTQTPIDPFRAVRVAMLAKASTLVGAGVAGVAAGLLAFVLTRPVAPSLGSTGAVIASVVGGLVLVAAGLVAEHLCTIRKDDDDEHPGPPEPGLGLSHHD
ncbi:DUF3180 domain-containing protein [Microbacterium sp. VKM Ac-2870]|uniref:DUF3180 domain-containing protein n=1 Tax=Microbacterium sp. VKM Ac-2870 TaxID=2783825 RepID=UPI00188C8C94|nr:DUF3180 domain-containing protein [Microbacterium sp. VKM Ac-2870]MBF4562841.1 DUF3180 domain-containing protein [Microbacterium sp. VKM Ac-2870]